jgi:uncharacterized RDD family membrane protein YckC
VESDDGKPPVARLLTASARRAERVAQATGVERALDAAVEEAIVRALRSPAVTRAVERAIESHALTAELNSAEIAQVIRRALDSRVAEEAWAEVLASEQVQMLIERIAGAPELRAAIAAQSAGLISDMGVRLAKLTEALDDVLERIFRPGDSDSETNQAGLATRLMAAAIDIGLLAGVYLLASGVVSSLFSFTIGRELSPAEAIVLSVLGFLLAGGTFVVFWALAGQTPGMRFVSIRIVHAGSRHLSFGLALRRLLALLLALLPAGLGYFAIVRDPRRRGWHDRMVGTEVIYDRAARQAPYAVRPRSDTTRTHA